MALSLGVHASASVGVGSSAVTAARTTQVNGSGIWIGLNYDNTLTFVSIVDNKGNTPVQIGSEVANGTHYKTRRYYIANAKGGAGHTFTLSCTGSSSLGVCFQEILTTAGAGVSLDQQNAALDSASPFTSPALLTTFANEMLLGLSVDNGPSGVASHTWGNGFLLTDEDTDASSYWTMSSCSQVVSAIGTYNTTVTITGGVTDCIEGLDTFSEMIAVFRKTLSGIGSRVGTRQVHGN